MGDWGGGDGGGRGRMGGQKRQFPYWSEVQPMEVRQRQAVGVQPELDPRYGIPRHAPSSLLDDADQVRSTNRSSPGFLDHLCRRTVSARDHALWLDDERCTSMTPPAGCAETHASNPRGASVGLGFG